MKFLLLFLFSNILFAQSVPEPNFKAPDSLLMLKAEMKRTEELKEAFSPFFAIKKYSLGLIKFNAVADYSTTGATFKIFNPAKKTIKYIWFTVAGENPVGDLVKTGTGFYKTVKGIGPIGSGDTGEWSFDYVWLTDVVETIKISTIKIQYMDGTFKTLKYNSGMYIGEEAYDNLIYVLNKKSETNPDQSSTNFPNNVSANDSTIYTDVEQTAEFPGGVNAFRNKVSGSFDGSAMNGDEGVVKTEVTFVIEKDGSLSDIKASGKNSNFNTEATRTIKSIKNKWTPSKINGIPVRYRYRLPLTMNFEG